MLPTETLTTNLFLAIRKAARWLKLLPRKALTQNLFQDPANRVPLFQVYLSSPTHWVLIIPT